jgi:hypothetical protein
MKKNKVSVTRPVMTNFIFTAEQPDLTAMPSKRIVCTSDLFDPRSPTCPPREQSVKRTKRITRPKNHVGVNVVSPLDALKLNTGTRTRADLYVGLTDVETAKVLSAEVVSAQILTEDAINKQMLSSEATRSHLLGDSVDSDTHIPQWLQDARTQIGLLRESGKQGHPRRRDLAEAGQLMQVLSDVIWVSAKPTAGEISDLRARIPTLTPVVREDVNKRLNLAKLSLHGVMRAAPDLLDGFQTQRAEYELNDLYNTMQQLRKPDVVVMVVVMMIMRGETVRRILNEDSKSRVPESIYRALTKPRDRDLELLVQSGLVDDILFDDIDAELVDPAMQLTSDETLAELESNMDVLIECSF